MGKEPVSTGPGWLSYKSHILLRYGCRSLERRSGTLYCTLRKLTRRQTGLEWVSVKILWLACRDQWERNEEEFYWACRPEQLTAFLKQKRPLIKSFYLNLLRHFFLFLERENTFVIPLQIFRNRMRSVSKPASLMIQMKTSYFWTPSVYVKAFKKQPVLLVRPL